MILAIYCNMIYILLIMHALSLYIDTPTTDVLEHGAQHYIATLLSIKIAEISDTFL